MIVTNHSELGSKKDHPKTGWYLPEVAHPYHAFEKAGITMVIASPKGGLAPMDVGSGEAFKEDPICAQVLQDKHFQKQIANTEPIKDIDISQFKAIFFAGGHGPMWDCDEDAALMEATKVLYEAGGVVSAVCHGTAGLVNVKLSNGDYLVRGRKVTCFTNAEEHAVQLMEWMPFELETKLTSHRAQFVDGGMWQENVVEDGCIITGQNPQSANKLAEAVVAKIIALPELKF